MKPDDLLARVPLFQALSPDDRTLLGRVLTEHRFPPGESVLTEAEPCSRLLLVAEGLLESEDGIFVFRPGDYFGELAILEKQPNSYGTVVAREPTLCYILDSRQLMARIRTAPDLAVSLLQAVGRRLAIMPTARTAAAAGAEGASDLGAALSSEQIAIYIRDFRLLFEQERKRANDLQDALTGIVRAFVGLGEKKDPGLAGHGSRVARNAQQVAAALDWPAEQQSDAALGGLLHDIGNIALESALLVKQSGLNAAEWELIQSHPRIGAEIIQQIAPLKQLVPYILYHHERWDGRGYPDRLSGTQIPIEGRLIAVVDVYDTLVSRRRFRGPESLSSAVSEIRGQAGTSFDPTIADAFYRCFRGGKLALPG